MPLDKELQKRNVEDWLSAFPQLSAYTPSKLYKVVGCCIIGIELVKLPFSDEYRPHFVIYKLWGKCLEECLSGPMLMVQLHNKKGLQFNIPYIEHDLLFHDVVECFKKQVTIPMNGDVPLKTFIKFVDHYFNSESLVKINPVQQALLCKLKFYSLLYAGGKPEKTLKQILSLSKKWDMSFFESQIGSFDSWFQILKNDMCHKDDFMNGILLNKQNPKIKKLHSSELIMQSGSILEWLDNHF